MGNLEFITVTTFNKETHAIIARVEQGKRIAVTKNGIPVILIQKVSNTVKGRTESITELKNKTTQIVSEIEKTGKQLIITRDNEPVVVIQRVTDNAFSIEK